MSVVTATAGGNSGANATPVVASSGDSILISTTGNNQGVKLPPSSVGDSFTVFLKRGTAVPNVHIYDDSGASVLLLQGTAAGRTLTLLEPDAWYPS